MKVKSTILFISAAVFAISGCKKEQKTNPIPPVVVKQAAADVYVAGYSFASNSLLVAAYWKNGIMFRVADSTESSQASAILVNGADVYLAGLVTKPNGDKLSCYWKNGTITQLGTVDYSNASGIFLNGNSVVVSGNIIDDAVYWNDGAATYLPGGFANSGGKATNSANAIVGNSSGIYVAGAITSKGNSVATCWKNGKGISVSDSLDFTVAYGMALDNNDVYMAGYIDGKGATYWKNGLAIPLKPGAASSMANSIAVNGTDVYAAGYVYINNQRNAAFWKNGTETDINAGATSTEAYAVAVNGSDVYLAGSAGTAAYYWKNGTPVLVAASAYATSIVVVPK